MLGDKRRAVAVPSQRLLEIVGSASGAMTVLPQAARSMLLLADGWPRLCQPSTLRMLIWPEASSLTVSGFA
jgi:hypothetical protein